MGHRALMGWGLLAYLILWIVVPKGPGLTPAMRLAEERSRDASGWRRGGMSCSWLPTR
jgi:hypothetical protein